MTATLSRSTAPSKRPARARRGKLARRIALGTVAGGVVVALGLAFRPRPLEVDLAPVTRGDVVETVEEMGKTRVRDRYVVSAPLGGNLIRVELRAGDEVESGAVLARIVPLQPVLLDARSRTEARARVAAAEAAQRQARAAIARAELAEANARVELARAQRLVASGSVAPNVLTSAELEARLRVEELASARFAEQSAANEAAMARAAVVRFDPAAPPSASDVFAIPSPSAGRVLKVVTQSAGPVVPGTPLVEVGDPRALEIVADILSADAVRMHRGAPVIVDRWGGPPLAAHVRLVEPSAFTRISALGVEEQRAPVIIDLDDARDRWSALGDGYRVEVRVTVAERRGVLRVPLASVFRFEDGWALYAMREGRARVVPVTLGVRSDTAVEIERGVTDADRVVVHPSERIADGLRIAERR